MRHFLFRALFITVITGAVVLTCPGQTPDQIKDSHLLLFKYIRNGDVPAVDSLIKKVKVPPDAKYFNHVTALGYAAMKGDTAVAKILIDQGANVNGLSTIGSRQMPPIGFAMMNRKDAVVKLLLQRGAKWKVPVPSYFSQSNHYNALIHATMLNNLSAARLLLDKGANVNELSTGAESFSVMGKSALIIAGENRFIEIANLLISQNADLNLFGKGWESAASSPLIAASIGGDTALIKLMIDKGVNVNAADGAGMTPLLGASSRSHTDAARILIRHGANVNVIDKTGNNALLTSILMHRASVDYNLSSMASGYDEFLQFTGMIFQDKDAWLRSNPLSRVTDNDLMAIETDFQNTLMPKVMRSDWDTMTINQIKKYEQDNLVFTGFLLTNGINVAHKNSFNQTASYLLNQFKMYEALRLLLEAGAAEPNIPVGFLLQLAIKPGDNNKLKNYLVTYNSQFSASDRYKALTWAALTKNTGALELLVSHGCNVNASDANGLTALHYAAYSGDSAMVAKFLALNANKGNKSKSGVQAYHVARFAGKNKLLSTLTPEQLTNPKSLETAYVLAKIERDLLEMKDPVRAMRFDNNRDDYYLSSIGKTAPLNDPFLNWMQKSFVGPYRDNYIQVLFSQPLLTINSQNNSLEQFYANQDYNSFAPFEFKTTAYYKNGSNSARKIEGNGPLKVKTSEEKESTHDAATSSGIQMAGMKQIPLDTFRTGFYVWSGAYAWGCGGWKNSCATVVAGNCIGWKDPEPRRGMAGYTVKGIYKIPKVSLLNNKYNVAYPGVRIRNYPKSVPLTIVQKGVAKLLYENEYIEMDRQLGDITLKVEWNDEVSASGKNCQERGKESMVTVSFQPLFDVRLESDSASFEHRLHTYRRIYSIKHFHEQSFDSLSPVENYSLLTTTHLLSELAKRKYKDVIKAELIGVVKFFENTSFKNLNDALIGLAEVEQIERPEILLTIDQMLSTQLKDPVLMNTLTGLKQQVQELPVEDIRKTLQEYKRTYAEVLALRIKEYNILLLEYSMYIPNDQLLAQLEFERIPLWNQLFTETTAGRFRL